MKLPKGYTEEQVLAAVKAVADILAPDFAFGIYSEEDIRQECFLMAMDAITRYDPERRPLESLLFVHCKNRCLNLIRNKLHRNDPPCKVCHASQGKHSDHPSGDWCRTYLAWKRRNAGKASLMRPLDLEHVADENEHRMRVDSSAEADVEYRELLRTIDENLAVELRSTYLLMRAGKSVPRAQRQAVEAAVREILGETA